MLEGNNTTISIAHRLSTIQRSDSIICIGADGKVAQVGSYAELSADREGAFSKLMEWQMSGGSSSMGKAEGEVRPDVLEEEGLDGGEGEEVTGEKEGSGEAVLERTKER